MTTYRRWLTAYIIITDLGVATYYNNYSKLEISNFNISRLEISNFRISNLETSNFIISNLEITYIGISNLELQLFRTAWCSFNYCLCFRHLKHPKNSSGSKMKL